MNVNAAAWEDPSEDASEESSCKLSKNIEESENSIELSLLHVSYHVSEGNAWVEVGATDPCWEHNRHEHAQQKTHIICLDC